MLTKSTRDVFYSGLKSLVATTEMGGNCQLISHLQDNMYPRLQTRKLAGTGVISSNPTNCRVQLQYEYYNSCEIALVNTDFSITPYTHNHWILCIPTILHSVVGGS